MQGRDTWTGYLKVYVKNPSVNIIDISPVWMESGPKGDRWIMSRIPLIFGGQYHVRKKNQDVCCVWLLYKYKLSVNTFDMYSCGHFELVRHESEARCQFLSGYICVVCSIP